MRWSAAAASWVGFNAIARQPDPGVRRGSRRWRWGWPTRSWSRRCSPCWGGPVAPGALVADVGACCRTACRSSGPGRRWRPRRRCGTASAAGDLVSAMTASAEVLDGRAAGPRRWAAKDWQRRTAPDHHPGIATGPVRPPRGDDCRPTTPDSTRCSATLAGVRATAHRPGAAPAATWPASAAGGARRRGSGSGQQRVPLSAWTPARSTASRSAAGRPGAADLRIEPGTARQRCRRPGARRPLRRGWCWSRLP